MQTFACARCGLRVHFENTACERCGAALAFVPETLSVHSITILDNSAVEVDGLPGKSFGLCANNAYAACNWLVEPGSAEEYCRACRLNRRVPDLSVEVNLDRWRQIEIAKHRLVYELLRFRLPVEPKANEDAPGIAFDFLADEAEPEPVLTGHDNGLITLNIAEADDAERESRRLAMGEPYRTLLGHFRHEIGHYYWDVLVAGSPHEQECRALFGDEREDYGEALKRHYDEGAPADWQNAFISTYATAHPWEDWAECWAHVMHMVATIDTAMALNLTVIDKDVGERVGTDAYRTRDFAALLDVWYPLTEALNTLNRSMGANDPYPFVINTPTSEKLAFIHRLIADSAGARV